MPIGWDSVCHLANCQLLVQHLSHLTMPPSLHPHFVGPWSDHGNFPLMLIKAGGLTSIRDLDQPVAQIFKTAVPQSMQRWQAGMTIDCKSHTMDANRVAKRPSDLSHLLALKTPSYLLTSSYV